MSIQKSTLYYIEDWILYLANRITENGEIINFPFFRNAPIKLANYDRSFIWNTASQISRGQGLTDRQLDTAVIVIVKHSRQIRNKTQQDVAYVEQQKPMRLPLRQVNRDASLIKILIEKRYELRFPYNSKMIDEIHELKATHGGISEFQWNKQTKCWHIDAVEPNLACLYSFLESRTYFDIDSHSQADLDAFGKYYQSPCQYLPTVECVDTGLVIKNSNPQIDQAIQRDGFLDLAPVDAAFRAHCYGLEIGKNLCKYVLQQHSDIAQAVLWTPGVIKQKRRTYTETLSKDNIESLLKTLKIGGIVFVSAKQKHSFFDAEYNRLAEQYPGKIHKLYVGLQQEHDSLIDRFPDDSILIFDVQESQNYSLRRRYRLNDGLSDFIDNQALKVLYIQSEDSKDLLL